MILRPMHLQLHTCAWRYAFPHMRHAGERRLSLFNIGFSTSGHKSLGHTLFMSWAVGEPEASKAGGSPGQSCLNCRHAIWAFALFSVSQDVYSLKAIASVLCCLVGGTASSC